MARSVTAYVSAHQRNRTHVSSFPRGEVFNLGADFTACLDGATISSVLWQSSNVSALGFGSGDIDGGLATIVATAGCGGANAKALATLSDGRKVAQLYAVSVQSSPWFSGESAPSTGSASVTVTA